MKRIDNLTNKIRSYLPRTIRGYLCAGVIGIAAASAGYLKGYSNLEIPGEVSAMKDDGSLSKDEILKASRNLQRLNDGNQSGYSHGLADNGVSDLTKPQYKKAVDLGGLVDVIPAVVGLWVLIRKEEKFSGRIFQGKR